MIVMTRPAAGDCASRGEAKCNVADPTEAWHHVLFQCCQRWCTVLPPPWHMEHVEKDRRWSEF